MATAVPPAVKRLGIAALFIVGAWFAVEGGEFSTLDLFRQRTEQERITKSIDSLQHVVDSLSNTPTKCSAIPRRRSGSRARCSAWCAGTRNCYTGSRRPRDSTSRRP